MVFILGVFLVLLARAPYRVFNFSSNYFLAAIVLASLWFLSLGLYVYKLRRAKSVVVFGDITCGELTDTLVFLDWLVNRYNYPAFLFFSPTNIENFVYKSKSFAGDISTQLEDIFARYGLLKALKRCKLKLILYLIVTSAVIILSVYIYMLVVEEEAFLLDGELSMIPILLLILASSAVSLFLLSILRPPKEFDSITKEDLDKLEELIIKIIDLTTKNMSTSLAIILRKQYPKTKREGEYILIESGFDHEE